MSTLTEISVNLRKIMLWLGLIFLSLLFLKFTIDFIISYWKLTHPFPPPAPNVRFNILPKPRFPPSEFSANKFIYLLENIEGKPPETTASARVYAMPKKLPSLLSTERAKNFARKLDFVAEPEIDKTIYQYIDHENTLRSLTVDSVNLNFHYRYDFVNVNDFFTGVFFEGKEQVSSTVKGYLQNTSLFDASILSGKITITPLIYKKEVNQFETASSLSIANAARVDFFREDLDKMRVLPPEFFRSFNYVIYIPSVKGEEIVEISYIFWPIAFNDFATYPVKPSTQAWQELTEGKATIIDNQEPTNQITIRKIYLAYYDDVDPQAYLQPIFVFEGDNNFVAYLAAITSEYLPE